MLGGLFGVLRGAIVIGLVVLVAVAAGAPAPDVVAGVFVVAVGAGKRTIRLAVAAGIPGALRAARGKRGELRCAGSSESSRPAR